MFVLTLPPGATTDNVQVTETPLNGAHSASTTTRVWPDAPCTVFLQGRCHAPLRLNNTALQVVPDPQWYCGLPPSQRTTLFQYRIFVRKARFPTNVYVIHSKDQSLCHMRHTDERDWSATPATRVVALYVFLPLCTTYAIIRMALCLKQLLVRACQEPPVEQNTQFVYTEMPVLDD